MSKWSRSYICEAGRIVGPLDPSCHPHVHTSRFGVIPKSTLEWWRLILDMLSPEDGSVNDRVKEPWCSLSYATVTDAAHRVTACGRGSMLIKLDIRNAYRVFPVHPEDRWLMGMLWKGSLYVNTALPFGLQCTFGTQDIHRSGQCSWVDCTTARGGIHHSIPGWLLGRDGVQWAPGRLCYAPTFGNFWAP